MCRVLGTPKKKAGDFEKMKYYEEILLKDGRKCVLRNGVASDGLAAFENFNLTHAETDFLLSYPDENSYNAEEEGKFLQEKTDSADEIEIIAEVGGKIAGMAGIEKVGSKFKLKHRAELGISIAREYWRLGIGRALVNACVKCAKEAGYKQLELDVVADNEAALSLYKRAGFVEYGRNPRGFFSRISGYQPLVYMRLELD